MEIVEMLVKEHGLIRQFLDNLDLAVEKIEGGERPPREFFEKAVKFARNSPPRRQALCAVQTINTTMPAIASAKAASLNFIPLPMDR